MDHFKDIYEPSWVMWAHLVGVFVFEILGSYLVLSIIRYEHERTTHETLIHSLTLFVYKMPIVHNMTRFNIEVARALLGPLPNLLCMTTVFFNIFLTIVSLLTFNEIMVLRYLYICVWKNVGKLNDDFFSAFLIVANLFLGSFFALVTMMSQDVQVFLYGVCIGEDPSLFVTTDSPFPVTPRLTVLLALLTGALHCTLYVPIIREKSKRTDPMTSNQNGGQAIPIWAKLNLNVNRHQEIIKEMGENVSMVLLVVCTFLPGLVLRSFSPKSDLFHETKTQLFIFSSIFVTPLVHTLICPMIYLFRHPKFLVNCQGFLWR
ncbi:uncharacterized protein LOC131882493 [Tigriopus californicus]|uniref:uncharacterized protein LOC131882493 n=1 Tax=Tigriopus californicus TaxID=6832 RepID=UPI0027DA241A|nr:uncharacterized protein LOC131882493 [Tigriopus californicus]